MQQCISDLNRLFGVVECALRASGQDGEINREGKQHLLPYSYATTALKNGGLIKIKRKKMKSPGAGS